MDKDQIIKEQADKIKDLQESIAIFKQMINVLLLANRKALVNTEMAEDDCAEIFYSKFPRATNEFGFSTDTPLEKAIYID